MNFAETMLHKGMLPDWLIRLGIRHRLRQRLAAEVPADPAIAAERLQQWIAGMNDSPIAIDTAAANRQHYEVPAAFYQHVLGSHRKYSCGLFATPDTTLDEAEAAMLALTCERGQLQDGMSVLDLGCGWGALSLWIAGRYPGCRVLAVSNSQSQREYITGEARQRGYENLEVVTADANQFTTQRRFHRVFSVEMFEHLRNWGAMLARLAGLLHQDGAVFVHVFTHRSTSYPFLEEGEGQWLARHFFTGGQMPADSQMLYLQDDLVVDGHWRVSGVHYQRTAEAWLANFDRHRLELAPVLRETYGSRDRQMANAWRTFFLACAELWGFRGGREWMVSHYRLRPR